MNEQVEKVIKSLQENIDTCCGNEKEFCESYGCSTLREIIGELKKISAPISGSAERVKEIASIAWRGASNAYGLYPENKRRFAEFWEQSKSLFDKFSSADEGREKAADEYISFLEEYWGIPYRGIKNSITEKFREKYLASKPNNPVR